MTGACVATLSIALSEHKAMQDRERFAEAVKKAAERDRDRSGLARRVRPQSLSAGVHAPG